MKQTMLDNEIALIELILADDTELSTTCTGCDADLRGRTDWEPFMRHSATGETLQERTCYACMELSSTLDFYAFMCDGQVCDGYACSPDCTPDSFTVCVLSLDTADVTADDTVDA